MICVGRYRFSEQDASRTLALADDLWEQLVEGRPSELVDHLRPVPGGDAAADLAVLWDALAAAGEVLRGAGALPDRTVGSVTQLSVSAGGVPKRAVDHVDVGWAGVVGDRQATRVHHGRPWQALCLWSSDVIGDLQRRGHPIAAGAAGENVSIAGLPWAHVRAGVRLRLGSVQCEVRSFALPCAQNARWFLHGEFAVMHHDRGPVSRVYATVIEPGAISLGDQVVLEP